MSLILARGALSKTIDNADAEEKSEGPEKIEHKAVTYRAYKVLEVVPESKEQVMPNIRINTYTHNMFYRCLKTTTIFSTGDGAEKAREAL